jgi:methylmalonyl-CoA decarboxylase
VLSRDIVISDKTCSFPITPVNLGLPYSETGLIRSMNHIPVNLVEDLSLTAAPVDAGDAEKRGNS